MALDSRLGDEKHGAVGRVENMARAAGMGGARVSRGYLEKGPENSGERSGLKRRLLKPPRKRRPAFLSDERRVVVNHPPMGWT